MSWGERSALHRTAKLLLDRGIAKTPQEAVGWLNNRVLQVAVGRGISASPAAVAALGTVINTGSRVFLGGVRVRISSDEHLTTAWAHDLSVADFVRRYGGSVVEELSPDYPTIRILDEDAVGGPVATLVWNGWSAGVLVDEAFATVGQNPVAGVLANTLGVSEMFQHVLGAIMPGRRSVGVSLWMPGTDWRSPEGAGPDLEYLPSKFWILGLGHLGQALAWTVGFLPYADRSALEIGLFDFDRVEEGNLATQLLTTRRDLGRRKTRIVGDQLEALGMRTRLVERAFDGSFIPNQSGKTEQIEPIVAFAGFDKVAPRAFLDVFDYAVDAGLGVGEDYLDSLVRTFPGTRTAAELFGAATEATGRPLGTAYQAEVERLVATGVERAAAQCGMLEIAGVSVGASFVGAAVSCLVISDALRCLHGGVRVSSIGFDLRNPNSIQTGTQSDEWRAIPAHTRASS